MTKTQELAEDSWDKESIYYLENPYHNLDNYIYTDMERWSGKHQKSLEQRKKEIAKRRKKNKNKKTHRKK